MLFEAIVSGVKSQGGFDVDDAMVGGWVNEMHRTAVASSKWLMQTYLLGPTVAGQAAYVLPASIVEVDGLFIEGPEGVAEYSRVGTVDLWDLKAGNASLEGRGAGVFAPNFAAAGTVLAGGTKQIELYPAPDATGLNISVLAAMEPADLVTGDSPIIPLDLHGDLLDGAISLGMGRIDERLDSAAVYGQKFAAMVAELTRRATRRVGSGPQRLRLYGADWV